MIAAICLVLLGLASALLAWIDLRRGIIPDWLNLVIAVIGLARAALLDGWAAALGAGSEGIVIGAIAWLLRRLYFVFRGFQGLGLGDVKLLAASGIWIGVAGVPVQLLVASLTALAAAAVIQLIQDRAPERGAFCGVCAGSQLVEQNQAALVRQPENGCNARDM